MALIKLNNKAVSNATAFGSISSLGSMTFIKKLTASGSSTLSFVDGASGVVLDDTYKEYVFTFNNIHPATDGSQFQVNFRDGGTAYDAVKTTTFFLAYHAEAGNDQGLTYAAGSDIAQGTGFQNLIQNIGNGNDECGAGNLTLYNPSSTTFVKHFIAQGSRYGDDNYQANEFVAGYCNTTTAIDGVQFKFNSGNIDSGDICLYGIA